MIRPPLEPRGNEAIRSQLAAEVALAAYSFVVAALLVRVAFKLFGVGDLVWTGGVVYALTDPLFAPFRLIPAARRYILAEATLADLTVLGLAVLVPLLLLIRRRDGPMASLLALLGSDARSASRARRVACEPTVQDIDLRHRRRPWGVVICSVGEESTNTMMRNTVRGILGLVLAAAATWLANFIVEKVFGPEEEGQRT